MSKKTKIGKFLDEQVDKNREALEGHLDKYLEETGTDLRQYALRALLIFHDVARTRRQDFDDQRVDLATGKSAPFLRDRCKFMEIGEWDAE